MSDTDASRDGPPLLRPIPRRPFVFDLKCPTPQSLTPPQDDDESDSEEQQLENEMLLARFRRDLMNAGIFNSRPSHDSPPDSPTGLTQSQSTANLNSSTLAGIYDCSDQEDVFNGGDDDDELHTPWGTGAETPVKRRRDSISRGTYELMRDRSNLPRRRLSYHSAETTPLKQPMTPAGAAVSLASRAAVLFVLGAGYGVLVTHLHHEQRLLQLPDASHILPRYNGSYLALWGFGLAGVALGALQPWFDGMWDGLVGSEGDEVETDSKENLPETAKQAAPETDWALVMRAVGVFVGVAFAVRRLAWTSSMQLSVAVALANFVLWWLIDRSIPALILSSGVGLAGSVFLLGVNPDVIPAPTGSAQNNSSFSNESHAEFATVLGGIATQETIEAGIWMLSVLFCTCLCFGNIGRRLAKGKSKGRWGGLQ
ncbi:insig domain-containing [Trichoderma arundinaceum]|uniref:Insig domain-containing n=1 Tax=Trichoderma arundinaceum TaxID=490622 RepID=A0A395N7X8_TRIAR|nr:insig domain-containing [Trichoderma arundinaceum]